MTTLDELFSNADLTFEEILQAFRLDISYDSAEGDYLFARVEDKSTRILDVVGGFGVNLLGHYHPDLVAVLEASIRSRVPFAAQGSVRSESQRLARRLRDMFGPFETILTNSGAETVEAAIKHACLEQGRTRFLAVRNSYHGKTLGAQSLTAGHRNSMSKLGMQVGLLDPATPETWRACEADVAETAGVFVEPIQGEGGIRPLPEEFCEWVQAFCRRSGIPLIADEIQCGLGRSGAVLASHQLGLTPDYICLGKALGGGLVKIGALLIHETRFRPEFRWRHTSTFAADGLSSRVGDEVLSLIERDRIPQRCSETGSLIRKELTLLQSTFPDVVADIRGCGLMLGFEIAEQSANPSNMLRLLSEHRLLGFLASSYLLNVHRIRIAPTLSDPQTLRIQPSAYFAACDLKRLSSALIQFCEAIHHADAGHLIGHLLDPERPLSLDRPRLPHRIRSDSSESGNKVAFIAHPLDVMDLRKWDPSLTEFSDQELMDLGETGSRFLGPCVYDQHQVRSRTGDSVNLAWIGLLPTSAQMYAAHRTPQSDFLVRQIEQAVEMAKHHDCRVAGLGGYTSILTLNCRRLRNSGIGLTSGNALTVGMCLRAAEEVAASAGIQTEVAAVVGAAGNIGRVYSMLIAPKVQELVLVVGNPNSRRSLRLFEHLQDSAPATRLTLTSSMELLPRCQLIVGASNSPEPVIFPEHVGTQPCVICDVALPSDVCEHLCGDQSHVHVIRGGIVRLPHDESLTLSGLSLPPGRVFACIAETLLMGLAGIRGHGSYGDISTERVEELLQLADLHGFRHEVLFRRQGQTVDLADGKWAATHHALPTRGELE